MRKKQIWQIVGCAALGLGVASLLGGYWYVQHRNVSDFQQQIAQLPDGKDKVTLAKDRVTLDNATYGNLVQAVGGILLFVTAYVSLQNLKATQENVKVAQKNLEATQEKQVTERYTQAINQLGSENLTIRTGGIYSLERIANDSRRDHATIMEVLSSFIQTESVSLNPELVNSDSKIEKDIQAALTVIGRRRVEYDSRQLDLTKANLSGADLNDAKLNGANLRGAVLNRAHLLGSELRNASLIEAQLVKAHLIKVCLVNADLFLANLDGAYLIEAELDSARFDRASFHGADFSEASLINAKLCGATLVGANFFGANLSKADFGDADLLNVSLCFSNLEGADFRRAKNLEPAQLKSTKNWAKALYNADLRQQLGLPPERKSERQLYRKSDTN